MRAAATTLVFLITGCILMRELVLILAGIDPLKYIFLEIIALRPAFF